MSATSEDLNEVHAASIPANALHSVSDEHLGLFLNASRAANDLYLLHRVAIALSNSIKNTGNSLDRSDVLEREALNTQWLSTLTLLAGKSWEAWLFVEEADAHAHFNEIFANNPVAKTLKLELCSLLNENSPLVVARNNHSFHYNTKKLLAAQIAILRRDHTGTLRFAMGAGHHLSFYNYAERLSVQAVAQKMFPMLQTDQERVDHFATTTIATARILLRFFGEVIASVLFHGDKPPGDNIQTDRIDVSDRPTLDDLSLPFLVRFIK